MIELEEFEEACAGKSLAELRAMRSGPDVNSRQKFDIIDKYIARRENAETVARHGQDERNLVANEGSAKSAHHAFQISIAALIVSLAALIVAYLK